jgi:hypothetical protein
MPKGSPGVKRRPKTQAEKDHQRDMITKKWQDPEYQENVSNGLKRSWQEQERQNKHQETMERFAVDPDWLQRVSDGTKEALARPDVKARHSAAVKQAFLRHNNFMGGSVGDDFASILCPAGFIREHRIYYGDPTVQIFGYEERLRKKNFSLDFAHLEGKINIELDGPGHSIYPSGDDVRDSILRNLGWRIIRIHHD